MSGDRGRTLRALKNAADAGDEAAVRLLTEKLRAGGKRSIGAMTPEEIARLDPREHGGVAQVPFLDDPLLGAIAGGALFGKPAIAAGKAAAKVAGKVGGALGAGGVGAWVYDKLTGD